jgi:hypothetical protein
MIIFFLSPYFSSHILNSRDPFKWNPTLSLLLSTDIKSLMLFEYENVFYAVPSLTREKELVSVTSFNTTSNWVYQPLKGKEFTAAQPESYVSPELSWFFLFSGSTLCMSWCRIREWKLVRALPCLLSSPHCYIILSIETWRKFYLKMSK